MASDAPAITAELRDNARAMVDRGERLLLPLPGGGRLYVERPLPFLAVYRVPPDRSDVGTPRLVTGQPAFLVAPGGRERRDEIADLVEAVARPLAADYGAFLLLELWSRRAEQAQQPGFRVLAPREGKGDEAVGALFQALSDMRILRTTPDVSLVRQTRIAPPGLPPLLTPSRLARLQGSLVGLEVAPIHHDPQGEVLYPLVLRQLRRRLTHALSRAFFAFMQDHTDRRPQHYKALGRRTPGSAVWEVDRQLAEIAEAYDFTLQITPVNVEAAWRHFRAARFEKPPTFVYRPLPMDPALHKRRLYNLPLERIEDPALAHLFAEKVAEVDRQLGMLADRGTPRFLYGSLALFGAVEDPLHELALQILDALPARTRRKSGARLDAADFAVHAADEIQRYAEQLPGLEARVEVRPDVTGLMHSRGHILVGADATFAESRVEALIQHEVGTHMVCYRNGRAQPFHQLYAGLRGYRELQEGLAVLSEYLVGGLDRPRLRILAARVVAARAVSQGSTFIETFRMLHRDHGLPQHQAWRVAMRVHRGGGTVADAVYLRGLWRLLAHLAKGHPMEPLYIGRVALDHVPIVEELLWREVLRAPPLRPRYLDRPDVTARLQAVRGGLSPLDLVRHRSRHAPGHRRQ